MIVEYVEELWIRNPEKFVMESKSSFTEVDESKSDLDIKKELKKKIGRDILHIERRKSVIIAVLKSTWWGRLIGREGGGLV